MGDPGCTRRNESWDHIRLQARGQLQPPKLGNARPMHGREGSCPSQSPWHTSEERWTQGHCRGTTPPPPASNGRARAFLAGVGLPASSLLRRNGR